MRTLVRNSTIASLATLMLPMVAGAQSVTIGGIFVTIGGLINLLVGLAIGVAIIVFFIGVIKYISGGPEQKTSAMRGMLFGIVGIFVMVSVWGLVRVLGTTFLPNTNTSQLPVPYVYNPNF